MKRPKAKVIPISRGLEIRHERNARNFGAPSIEDLYRWGSSEMIDLRGTVLTREMLLEAAERCVEDYGRIKPHAPGMCVCWPYCTGGRAFIPEDD